MGRAEFPRIFFLILLAELIWIINNMKTIKVTVGVNNLVASNKQTT